jgi:cytoskeletal protein RodZ
VSIGQTLAAARREAGLSVDDVSAKTRLRATVIRAIESDDFSLCGGDFYARAHLRTLAGIVGADAGALVAEYDAAHGDPDELPVATQVFETEATGRAITRRTERRAPNWGAAAAAMVLVVVIIVAAVQLLGNGGGSGNTPVAQGTTSQSTAPTSPTPSTQATSEPTQTTPPAVTTPPSSAVAEAGVHVVLDITAAKCWVLASASNGSVIFQGVLNPGDSKTFDDPHKVSLRLGNAPATHLVVNNVDIGTPSSKSNVVDLSFGPGDPTQAQG